MRQKYLYILLFALGVSGSVKGQLNDYKYVIVPKKFDAFQSENMYLTSTMVKYYFTQNGFNAVYDDDLPIDLVKEPCLGLTADLLDFSSMIATKVIVVLKDCRENEVFRTVEGRSKEKEFTTSYKDAIQKAFVSFEGMAYNYVPKEKTKATDESRETITVSFKDDVKSVENLPNSRVVEQKATPEEQLYKSKEPVPSNITKVSSQEKVEEDAKQVPETENTENQFIAQRIENGYNILDGSSRIILKLQETSLQDVFLTDYRGSGALVFKKEGKWMLEYFENGQKYLEELDIIF